MTNNAAKPAILLSTAEIQKVIPHRWPFLLVDRVVAEERERGYIHAQKGVTATEWFFQGHFPQMPVMPGVLQVEALAQTLGIYVGRLEEYAGQIGLFAGIDGCRFRRVVQPGDTLDLEVTMTKLGRRLAKAHAVASVDGETACETDISAILAPEGALR
jgi:3-hydroxyacyl-[acyl-carrier-protein] dehydratase